MTTPSMTSDQSVPTHHGAVSVAVMAAVVPTVLSAQGMVAVARDTLNLPLTLALGCAIFLELGLVASALLARASVRRDGHSGADGAATWALSALSGSLSALHEVVGRELTGPHLLAAAVRLIAPLVAAWLWHRVLVADLAAAEPRPTRAQARRARRMLAVAAAAAEVERTEDGTGAHARAARRLRARNAALLRHVPGTDTAREPELRAWMTSVGQADVMPAWTRVPAHGTPVPDMTPSAPGPEDPTSGRADEVAPAPQAVPGRLPDMDPPERSDESRTMVSPPRHPDTAGDAPALPGMDISQVSPVCPGVPAPAEAMPGHAPGSSAQGDARTEFTPGAPGAVPGQGEDAGPGARAPHEAASGQDVSWKRQRARLADELIARNPDAGAPDLAALWAAEGVGPANDRTARRHLAQARERAERLRPVLA